MVWFALNQIANGMTKYSGPMGRRYFLIPASERSKNEIYGAHIVQRNYLFLFQAQTK
jgi:hypothetical protein